MLIDLSADATYGKSAVKPVPMPSYAPPSNVRPVPMPTITTAATDLLDTPDDWSWKQLRDYVLRSIAERHGPQPAGDEIKNASVFQAFHKRWGAQAGPIARFIFEQQDGYWRSAPVTTSRFTKGSDPYFAAPIAERLSA